MKIKKGTLVYVPSGVRLYRSVKDAREYDIYIEDFVVTKKPVNCLVVEGLRVHSRPAYSIIYEGRTWQVAANAVYQIDKEETNASHSS